MIFYTLYSLKNDYTKQTPNNQPNYQTNLKRWETQYLCLTYLKMFLLSNRLWQISKRSITICQEEEIFENYSRILKEIIQVCENPLTPGIQKNAREC